MAANKKNIELVDLSNLDEYLHSTGYLIPNNGIQLANFNRLYSDYNFKLKDKSIDVKSIIKGKACTYVIREIRIDSDPEEASEMERLKMVARKGKELPPHIIEKMRSKHKKNDK